MLACKHVDLGTMLNSLVLDSCTVCEGQLCLVH